MTRPTTSGVRGPWVFALSAATAFAVAEVEAFAGSPARCLHSFRASSLVAVFCLCGSLGMFLVPLQLSYCLGLPGRSGCVSVNCPRQWHV